MNISIIGLGRFGEALGTVLKNDGHDINGTTRTEIKLSHLHEKHFQPSILVYPDAPSFDLKSDIIILNIPPFPGQLEWFKTWNWSTHSKIIFISSTSTYPAPNSSSSEILLSEEEWVKSTFPIFSILRFGGLYSDSFHPGKYLSGKQNLPGSITPNTARSIVCRFRTLTLLIFQQNHFLMIRRPPRSTHLLHSKPLKYHKPLLSLPSPILNISFYFSDCILPKK